MHPDSLGGIRARKLSGRGRVTPCRGGAVNLWTVGCADPHLTAQAVSYGQAGENAARFPHLAHRSAAAHKLHCTTATTRYEFDSGEGETFSRQPALAYSPRKLSKQPEPSQMSDGGTRNWNLQRSRLARVPCPRHAGWVGFDRS